MHETTVFVLETRHRWTPELQRQFAAEEVRVRGVRKAADLLARANPSAHAVVVLDFGSAAEESLALLAQGGGAAGESPTIAVAANDQTGLEWALRELGVVAFLPEPVSGEDLAALCRKQWQRTNSESPKPEARPPDNLTHLLS